MHRAKRIKFEPSLAKARALESSTVRKCMEDIEKAGRTLSSCAVIPALPAECCERSIELLLVARLGLKGAECLRAAARMVPENFLGKRVEFVAAIFNETSGQILPLEACEGYLSLLRRCSSYSLLTEPQKTMQQLSHLSEVKGIGHSIFLSPPVHHCINPSCHRYGSALSIHHAPVNITVFTIAGPLPGSKLALKCSGCSLIYNYSKYGNIHGMGERFYDRSRELIEVSDVVYCERQLSNLFTYLK